MVIPPEQAIERKMERKCNNAFLVCGLHKAKFAFPAHFLVFCWRITYSSATPRGKIYANRISHNERMLSRYFFLFLGETQCHEASVLSIANKHTCRSEQNLDLLICIQSCCQELRKGRRRNNCLNPRMQLMREMIGANSESA